MVICVFLCHDNLFYMSLSYVMKALKHSYFYNQYHLGSFSKCKITTF